jgi:hypothetical protein
LDSYIIFAYLWLSSIQDKEMKISHYPSFNLMYEETMVSFNPPPQQRRILSSASPFLPDSDSLAMMKIYKEAKLRRSSGERAAVRW